MNLACFRPLHIVWVLMAQVVWRKCAHWLRRTPSKILNALKSWTVNKMERLMTKSHLFEPICGVAIMSVQYYRHPTCVVSTLFISRKMEVTVRLFICGAMARNSQEILIRFLFFLTKTNAILTRCSWNLMESVRNFLTAIQKSKVI